MSHCCHHKSEKACTGKGKAWFVMYWKPLLSAAMLLIGILLGNYEEDTFFNGYLALAWYILAYLPVGLPVLAEAWESVRKKDFFSEFTLMTLATLGAFYIGEYPEGVAVMLFYSIGEAFQDRAVDRAKRNIGALLDVRPETVNVVRNGETLETSPREVEVGEVIEVKAGGRISLDGCLLDGKASFDTAALTGESVPRTLREGDEVLAGMIVTDRFIRLEVTKPYDKSALARILDMVQNASERKAPAELFIRKFARIYTPVVIALSLLIVFLPWIWGMLTPSFAYVFNDWLYRGLIFLVISCPCALVVSIPLGYFGGIGAASRLGILFKGGNYLDAITKINTVAFDKTGTLTQGIFEVQAVEMEAGVTASDLLAWIASVERYSTHPIAKAVMRYAGEHILSEVKAERVEEIAGHGLRATLAGEELLVGNTRLLKKFDILYPAALEEIAGTIVACAKGGRYAGYLLLSDVLKPDAVQAVAGLKAQGVRNIVILSGDKQKIVDKFAKELGVTAAYGDLLPEGKVERIEALKNPGGNKVAFVGDGMNDAPVLALSDVGIAMGGLGSDAAIETADVVIQTDQPAKVAAAIRVGRTTLKIVWQNIFLAFGVKIVVLILGAGGLATMWEAVFADVGVALLAIMNAIRIQKMVK